MNPLEKEEPSFTSDLSTYAIARTFWAESTTHMRSKAFKGTGAPPTVKPKVLIATTGRWYPAARLAMALAKAGCKVEAVCPAGHPMAKTGTTEQAHTYYPLLPLISFRSAIARAKPDLIVSGDDLATRHLHQLHDRERQSGGSDASICTLIERSLGARESFPVVYARTKFMELAQEEGVRVPTTAVIQSVSDLRKWVSQAGFPTVLKADGSSGGDGTRVVHTPEEANSAFYKLQAPPLLARAVKRALLDRDRTLVWPSLLRRRFVVNAQAFVAGREATSAIVCWKGDVLASLQFEVVNKRAANGPATVLRLIDHPEMSYAAERIVRRLNLSGFHGFDFMLETQTGRAYLIEINPRTTQVGHLALGPGRDLPVALYAALSGENIPPTSKVTENDTIALFPQEWLRDPGSAFLQSGFHDVPWEEPELVQHCIRKSRKQRAWYTEENWLQGFSTVRSSSSPATARPEHRAVELDCEAK
jgi:hypothetical protein